MLSLANFYRIYILEEYGFELPGSTYVRTFYSTVLPGQFPFLRIFFSNLFYSQKTDRRGGTPTTIWTEGPSSSRRYKPPCASRSTSRVLLMSVLLHRSAMWVTRHMKPHPLAQGRVQVNHAPLPVLGWELMHAVSKGQLWPRALYCSPAPFPHDFS